jgi:hypothetical protein
MMPNKVMQRVLLENKNVSALLFAMPDSDSRIQSTLGKKDKN